jgi:multiple sugar transport system substrate-binding protein
LSGKTAMAIVPYNYLFQVVEANKNADRIENYEAIDWDVVTLPTHEAAPGIGSNVYYQGIFAINANAENLDDAWEFIKFITGEDFARIKSKSNNYLLARQDYIKPIDGVEYNLNAFMALSPPEYSSADQELYEKLPDYWSVQNIGQQKLYEVLREGKDVQLALQEWEAEGQMMIEQLLEQRENGGDGNVGIFGLTEEKLRLLEASGELINITTTEATAEEVAE